MRYILLISFIFLIAACSKHELQNEKKLELILLGVPEDSSLIKYGAQKYFLFNNFDSTLIKECTYLNEKTGEPLYPVNCNYFSKMNTESEKNQLKFLFDYFNSKTQGSISNIDQKESNCDLFGAWIAIYTNEKSEKKYFLFNCDGIPLQLRKFCSNLNKSHHEVDSLSSVITKINTDSIVLYSYKELEDIFKRIDSMKSEIKFIEN